MAVCTVCAHKSRGDIDLRLAVQVCNVNGLAREYGLGRDSVRRHREKHLPHFLPAFAATAESLQPGTIEAEAQRLYLIGLDALARAEAGVTVEILEQPDGTSVQVRKENLGNVARFMREARANLDLLHKLSVAAGSSAPLPSGVDRQLDERLIKALDRVADRRAGSPHATSNPTLSIEAVEYAALVGDVIESEYGHLDGGAAPTPTPGPSTAARGADLARLKESQIAGEQISARDDLKDLPPVIPSNMSAEEARKFYEDGPTVSSADRPEWSQPPVWTGNPAASDDERRAAGFEPLPLTGPASPAHPEIPLGNLEP